MKIQTPGRSAAPAIAAVFALVGLMVAAATLSGSPSAVAADTRTADTTTSQPAPAQAVEPAAVKTTTLTNTVGKYAVQVPDGLLAQRSGRTTKLVARDKSLVVTVVPTERVDPALGNAQVLRAMETSYRSVRTLRHEPQRIDGHRAVASYGTAVTTKGVTVQYVLVSVFGAKASYAISTFASADADPDVVLPQIRAVVNGFRASDG